MEGIIFTRAGMVLSNQVQDSGNMTHSGLQEVVNRQGERWEFGVTKTYRRKTSQKDQVMRDRQASKDMIGRCQ